MSGDFLLIQVSDREHTSYTTAPPFIIGPFGSEDEAAAFAAEHGMCDHRHDDYGGCLSVHIVANALEVTAPAEAAVMLAEEAE
jgi:hypothetical protein